MGTRVDDIQGQSLESQRLKPIRYVGVDSTFNMATSVDAKLLKQTKFPLEFSQKVDMKKVNVEVMKK